MTPNGNPANEKIYFRPEYYSWSTVSLTLAGVPVVEFTSIEAEETAEKTRTRGAGVYALGYTNGNREAGGTLELIQNYVQDLRTASPTGSLLDLPPFDIELSMITNAGEIAQHTIHNVVFTNDTFSASQGDETLTASLEFLATHITWV